MNHDPFTPNVLSKPPYAFEFEQQGASIIYNGNMLAQEAVRKLHLDVINIPRNESVGFWDGQTLVARTGSSYE